EDGADADAAAASPAGDVEATAAAPVLDILGPAKITPTHVLPSVAAAPACTGRPTSIARRAAPANDRPRHAMAAVRAALVVALALLQLAAEGPVHEDRVAEDHGQERQGA